MAMGIAGAGRFPFIENLRLIHHLFIKGADHLLITPKWHT